VRIVAVTIIANELTSAIGAEQSPNPNRGKPDQHGANSAQGTRPMRTTGLQTIQFPSVLCAIPSHNVSSCTVCSLLSPAYSYSCEMPRSAFTRVSEDNLYNRIRARLVWLVTFLFPRVPLCTQAALSAKARQSTPNKPPAFVAAFCFVDFVS
jgi:hypothetical protein